MTTTDRTGADTATFEARMAELDRLEVADEGAVERVARAMWDAKEMPADKWTSESPGWAFEREECRHLARAAIDALKPAPGTGSSGQMVVDVLRNGEHVATLDAVYGSVSVDTSGQVVQPTREDRAVARGLVRRARAAANDDEYDEVVVAVAREIATERGHVVQRVLDLHVAAHAWCVVCDKDRDVERYGNDPECQHHAAFCRECDHSWPCRTARAVTGPQRDHDEEGGQ